MRTLRNVLLLGTVMSWIGCGQTAGTPALISATVESQDAITSEDGVLTLTAGTLSIESISLLSDAGAVPLVGAASIDLLLPEQELELLSSIPSGEYTGLRIALAPAGNGAQTLDVSVELAMAQEPIRATTAITVSGDVNFPEGARTIAQDSTLELQVRLQGMFFYLAPVSDAVDGLYEAGEGQRDFLTMNLLGMFDLRVRP